MADAQGHHRLLAGCPARAARPRPRQDDAAAAPGGVATRRAHLHVGIGQGRACVQSPGAGWPWMAEIKQHDAQLDVLTADRAPELLAAHGMATGTAAEMLLLVGDNPERIHSEAAFAKLCGACPIPASSGKTNRHRLNRGGNRQANAPLPGGYHPHARPSADTGLRPPAHRGRQVQSRNHSLPQTLRRSSRFSGYLCARTSHGRCARNQLLTDIGASTPCAESFFATLECELLRSSPVRIPGRGTRRLLQLHRGMVQPHPSTLRFELGARPSATQQDIANPNAANQVLKLSTKTGQLQFAAPRVELVRAVDAPARSPGLPVAAPSPSPPPRRRCRPPPTGTARQPRWPVRPSPPPGAAWSRSGQPRARAPQPGARHRRPTPWADTAPGR